MRVLLPAIVALALAGCGESESASVTIETFRFAPDPLTVEAGASVTFENRDQTRHTATSGTRDQPDGRFDAKLAPGGAATVRFEEAGRYRYVCTLHQGPGMEAEVIVR